MKNNFARVAQLVEQLICNQPVVGSSPISGSGAVAQLGERRTCTAEVAGSIPVSSTIKDLKFFDNLEIGKIESPVR